MRRNDGIILYNSLGLVGKKIGFFSKILTIFSYLKRDFFQNLKTLFFRVFSFLFVYYEEESILNLISESNLPNFHPFPTFVYQCFHILRRFTDFFADVHHFSDNFQVLVVQFEMNLFLSITTVKFTGSTHRWSN